MVTFLHDHLTFLEAASFNLIADSLNREKLEFVKEGDSELQEHRAQLMLLIRSLISWLQCDG